MAEVVGFAATVLQITTACLSTVNTLEKLRLKYRNSANAIKSLYSESSALRGSLMQLSYLVEQKDGSLMLALESKVEFRDALQTALSGCRTVFTLLQQKLDDIVLKSGQYNNFLGLKKRASFLWSEKLLRGYAAQIHGHQEALTLLLQVIHMHSLSDLNQLLQETKSILAKTAQDQITLQSSPSRQTFEASDAETNLEGSATDCDCSKNIDIISTNGDSSSQPRYAEIEQASLADSKSAVRLSMEKSVSALDGLKLQETGQRLEPLAPKSPACSHETLKKRDSAQSSNYTSPLTASRRENEACTPSSRSKHSRQQSKVFSPLASEFSEVDGRKSMAESPTARFERSPSMQSSYPEVVSKFATKDPFPKVQNPPQYLPALAEDQQNDLLRRRYTIVTSEDQLLWAEEALHFVAITARQRVRISRTQTTPEKAGEKELELQRQAWELVKLHLPNGDSKALFLQASYQVADLVKTLELFQRSLGHGYTRSAFYIANMLEANPLVKRSTILDYYMEGAAANDTACNYRLAEAYLKGELGLRKEAKDAIWHLRKAVELADRDFPQSLFLLGLLQTESYRRGVKIRESVLPVDEIAARENFKRGALLGCSKCQLHLAHAFRLGRQGLEKSPVLALHYFQLAARQGEPEADYQISTYFGWGEPGVVDVHPHLAFTYARRAAEDAYPPALAQVAYFYEKGVGVRQSKEKAKEWYLMAIARGDKVAEKRLDALRNRGTFGTAR
ncbi:uncharacterized protein PV09_02680 [Verruconis gallopava]|uniref:Azaphilone pigments biosynthesis cluster protein L N-terminal domain-containing protein n=1 Tax=Verruconis gallopava TaxID=253628 RepID=A0A0D1YZR5_9PEZI|nr:uncharacterized protein PV09_02680 [Verruconis gallopava]KIW06202.1 hypothetical protein PV09_02680 [Verruconis gallopava]